MVVGSSGVERVVQRTCDLMREHDTNDLRLHGGISLELLQKYLNFHYSISSDLFGQEISTNAANYYTMGLKGRFKETAINDDHLLENDAYPVFRLREDRIVEEEASALTSINERLRDDYIEDCSLGLRRWNQVIREAGINFELKLPHRAFNRKVGQFAGLPVTPVGKVIAADDWQEGQSAWLPTAEDRVYVESLMQPVNEPGQVANWLAPPLKRINRQPFEFEYVRFN